MPGRLILCATPIGNLGDASSRLANSLKEADLILAEDTRRSAVLLNALGVDRPLRSYFAGNEARRSDELERALASGQTVALITDAGTPAISDPGVSAVAAARRAGSAVSVVPGPSALTAALAVSGLPSERFVFEGFLPRKGRERRARLEALEAEARTAVLFVSPHHLVEDLEDLAQLGLDRPICVARELTKVFEEVQWTTVGEALTEWRSRAPQGEFTLVLAGAPETAFGLDHAAAIAMNDIEAGGKISNVVRNVADETGVSRRLLYEEVLSRTRGTNSAR
jgi:16S rRNA (cytidine1402-2'-O)-methyltransferase